MIPEQNQNDVSGLTAEDVNALRRPFDVPAHEFLRGFVYLREEVIADRLDSVDPSWSFTITSINHRDTTVYVHGALTVKGVTRENVGQEVVRSTKNGGDANEAEKSAATDAFKRAARLFGIGRYLLSAKNINDEGQLARWLGQQSLEPWYTENNIDKLLSVLADKYEIAEPDALKLIGASSRYDRTAWGKYATGKAAADAICILAYEREEQDISSTPKQQSLAEQFPRNKSTPDAEAANLDDDGSTVQDLQAVASEPLHVEPVHAGPIIDEMEGAAVHWTYTDFPGNMHNGYTRASITLDNDREVEAYDEHILAFRASLPGITIPRNKQTYLIDVPVTCTHTPKGLRPTVWQGQRRAWVQAGKVYVRAGDLRPGDTIHVRKQAGAAGSASVRPMRGEVTAVDKAEHIEVSVFIDRKAQRMTYSADTAIEVIDVVESSAVPTAQAMDTEAMEIPW